MVVTFYGSVLDCTNGEKTFSPGPCPDIRALIGKLAGRYGEATGDFMAGDETCFFLVNGRGIALTGGLGTKLEPGDKIDILPFADAG
jgi:molybdopterin converting factor small subunit